MAIKTKIRRILVIKNRAIGDTILMTGPLRLLRMNRPNHQIHVLVRSPAGELLENFPYVDRVISVAEPTNFIDRLAHWTRLVRRLREKRYELILNFHASFRTALTAKLLRSDCSVVNHHELRGRNWFSDLPVPGRGQVKSIIDRDLDLLRAIGISANVENAMPELTLTEAEKLEAASLFGKDRARPTIFLGVGASRETKRWPADHFATLVSRVALAFPEARFVLSTVPGDHAWVQDFLPRLLRAGVSQSRLLAFSGQRLRRTAMILSQCDLYVGNDSGMKHLAAALGVRTFTFFGPEAPLEWHPYDLGHHPYAFQANMPCRTESGRHWCSIPVCDRHGHRCMKELAPDAALEEITKVLRC
jgi:ADP-heptose:LPS heptosyltransferase